MPTPAWTFEEFSASRVRSENLKADFPDFDLGYFEPEFPETEHLNRGCGYTYQTRPRW